MTKLRFMLVTLAAILATVSVCGCDDPNYVVPPYYSYRFQVEGLEHFYTDAGPAFIGFPAPEYNASALFPFRGMMTPENADNRSGGQWDYTGLNGRDPHNRDIVIHGTRGVLAVDAGGRSMAVFEVAPTGDYQLETWAPATPPPDLTVIGVSPVPMTEATYYTIRKPSAGFDPLIASMHYTLGPDANSARAIIDSVSAKPFYEVPGVQATQYTRWVTDANVSHYTTYVYIDPRLKQKGPGNYSLDVDAKFSVTVGYRPWGRGPDEHYVCVIRESIPGNVTGLVPVTVQCFGSVSNSYAYELIGTYF